MNEQMWDDINEMLSIYGRSKSYGKEMEIEAQLLSDQMDQITKTALPDTSRLVELNKRLDRIVLFSAAMQSISMTEKNMYLEDLRLAMTVEHMEKAVENVEKCSKKPCWVGVGVGVGDKEIH